MSDVIWCGYALAALVILPKSSTRRKTREGHEAGRASSLSATVGVRVSVF